MENASLFGDVDFNKDEQLFDLNKIKLINTALKTSYKNLIAKINSNMEKCENNTKSNYLTSSFDVDDTIFISNEAPKYSDQLTNNLDESLGGLEENVIKIPNCLKNIFKSENFERTNPFKLVLNSDVIDTIDENEKTEFGLFLENAIQIECTNRLKTAIMNIKDSEVCKEFFRKNLYFKINLKTFLKFKYLFSDKYPPCYYRELSNRFVIVLFIS